jgi:hypothetical protein
MRREDQIRIRHLTEAASKAVTYSAGKQRSDLDDDHRRPTGAARRATAGR